VKEQVLKGEVQNGFFLKGQARKIKREKERFDKRKTHLNPFLKIRIILPTPISFPFFFFYIISVFL